MEEEENPSQEGARVWREREALREELKRLPYTIEGARRTDEISVRMRRLKARYKELGGILHEDDVEDDD